MNTTLNPRMNAMEFSMTLRNSCDSWVLSCSTPTPEISETYPGTRGSTHGDRKETRPARNAAIGRGRLFITESFYLPGANKLANKCGSIVFVGLRGGQKVAKNIIAREKLADTHAYNGIIHGYRFFWCCSDQQGVAGFEVPA